MRLRLNVRWLIRLSPCILRIAIIIIIFTPRTEISLDHPKIRCIAQGYNPPIVDTCNYENLGGQSIRTQVSN
jgi:hypothetical protein